MKTITYKVEITVENEAEYPEEWPDLLKDVIDDDYDVADVTVTLIAKEWSLEDLID
jgi:hypothetical protein